MSFIKESNIGPDEAMVLRMALHKFIPQLEIVVKEAKEDRKDRATKNLNIAKTVYEDLEEMLDA